LFLFFLGFPLLFYKSFKGISTKFNNSDHSVHIIAM
jgi:hypothetical protein